MKKNINITIFRDYKEDNWASMEVYADNLTQQLKKIVPSTTKLDEFTALSTLSQHAPKRSAFFRYGFRYIAAPLIAPFHQGTINHIIDQSNAHLVFFLNGKKTVITCHDVIVPFWRRTFSNKHSSLMYYVGLSRYRGLHRAQHIIADSWATKKELIHSVGVNADCVSVVPLGVAPSFRPITHVGKLKAFQRQHALPKRFILHVGSNELYKNIPMLLKVFASLAQQDKTLFLVKVGERWTPENIALMNKLHIGPRVMHLGKLSTEDLPKIYSLARCLVHPSFVEGFGLTVLEAMACGCPVVVSDIPALRELVGDAGEYMQLSKTERSASFLKLFLKQPNLQSSLSGRGRQRSLHYTWEKTAKETLKIYNHILKLT